MILNYNRKIFLCSKAVLVLLFFISSSHLFAQQTFVVNTNEDLPDIDLQDDLCKDSNGNCSLRAAIENANLTTETDNIHFNIPGQGPHTINLSENLPTIELPTIIDGKSQPGYTFKSPQIVISGENIPLSAGVAKGFEIRGEMASNSKILGLVIGNFGITNKQYGVGISIRFSNNNIVQANYIGIAADGESPLNNDFGIEITGENNLIGGLDPEKRNIISGNRRNGVEIGYGSGINMIQGNYIGTNIKGTQKVPNGLGVLARETNTYDGNLISGNDTGLYIEWDKNLVINNFIGTDYSGKIAIPNSVGIYVNGEHNQIGTPGFGNLISGNLHMGIEMVGGSYNILVANHIGTDIDGMNPLPNNWGLKIAGGIGNYIGGLSKESSNIISGNLDSGIYIGNSNLNEVYGNIIGVKADGLSSLPNGNTGIFISGNNNQIGDTNPGSANIIGMNSQGVAVTGNENKISGNSMFGNNLGIDLGADNRNDRNDRDDADSGPNNLQNYPEISNAQFDAGTFTASYSLDSDPSYSAYPLTVYLYISDGNRQGKEYIGNFKIEEYNPLKGKQLNKIQASLIAGLSLVDGEILVATAIDANGNTSEFSEDFILTVNGSCTIQTYYADNDGDGFGDPTNIIEECTEPEGYVSNADDCDDTEATIGEAQTWYLDNDNDGFGDPEVSQTTCSPDPGYIIDNTDCDDSDDTIYPGAIDDTLDGKDQNCDGLDGPVTGCQGTDLLSISEVCSDATSVYWQISNPGSCNVAGRWELRKSSSSGPSSGDFSLSGGESIQIVSGTVNKGKTQIVVYWNNSSGTEISSNQNVSGIECIASSQLAQFSEPLEIAVSPNPVDDGIGIYFTAPLEANYINAIIYNSAGLMMATESFSNEGVITNLNWDLNHSSWIEGVYILNVVIGNETYQAQFIK